MCEYFLIINLSISLVVKLGSCCCLIVSSSVSSSSRLNVIICHLIVQCHPVNATEIGQYPVLVPLGENTQSIPWRFHEDYCQSESDANLISEEELVLHIRCFGGSHGRRKEEKSRRIKSDIENFQKEIID